MIEMARKLGLEKNEAANLNLKWENILSFTRLEKESIKGYITFKIFLVWNMINNKNVK